MTMAARSVLKEKAFKKFFTELPEVLVQDPIHECAYHIPADKLRQYKAGPDLWARLTPDTVTFVIPGGDDVEDVPPFTTSPTNQPDVLIQFPAGKESYLISWEELQKFQIEQPKVYWDGFVGTSFVMPRGMELIAQLPGLRDVPLQAGT